MAIFRFAPSPTGYLHLGHAYSALLNFDLARAAGTRMLLRIEDTDLPRCRPEYETAIYEDLGWLGIGWEEPVRRQSEHLDAYRAAIRRLAAAGLVYPSFETRTEMARLVAERERISGGWPRDPDGVPLYPGHGKDMPQAERDARMAAGEPYALRLDMTAACRCAGPLTWWEAPLDAPGECRALTAAPEAWGDVVLGRKETMTSYHLSVTIDDALQGVTDVVRGQDLFWATSVHRLLQQLLGLPAPVYRHHRLILDQDGRKLAKSARSMALRELRARGATPADIRRMVRL